MEVYKGKNYEKWCEANKLPVSKKQAMGTNKPSGFSDEEIEEFMESEQDRSYGKLGVHLTKRDIQDKTLATTTGSVVTVRRLKGMC